ncbi:hypothetical protein MIAR_04590 [Microbacterium arabinogalactanolyticum]|uniref:Uncharacterized protein n=1 Tax=Microbacterium arabinogalactanolyticum TaxID=69365 RepID=A0ABQ5NDK5_9MICO|nr:hypothetical protein MIAR_04590 [Microbacterium arabinogalactanolyticum]
MTALSAAITAPAIPTGTITAATANWMASVFIVLPAWYAYPTQEETSYRPFHYAGITILPTTKRPVRPGDPCRTGLNASGPACTPGSVQELALP